MYNLRHPWFDGCISVGLTFVDHYLAAHLSNLFEKVLGLVQRGEDGGYASLQVACVPCWQFRG